jgi:hypothetical protein
MRLPKKGFKNPNRELFIALNLDQLQAMSDKAQGQRLDHGSDDETQFHHQHRSR